ncbi:oxidoreductase of aldo, keto reductase family, subgroup 1 [Fructilactobacillus florum 8D]|uniref:Oxidoreductase of aldo, keto reductase family, subgroup 1 n=2 Tax=Fructilactobacillus florum TaxID=640331 RepID=W9EL01_9LACO|nr:aldo/keto reductase [Fructilactobacillus florum]ETO40354.1 oxidoreductase of aldo, keto reductase family, subgroup 1 [Fructilactobacillus florum 8D]KRM92322.1 Glyoxal reductase [Fructilactobacillus florum DSM 22689 = JCM 16035]
MNLSLTSTVTLNNGVKMPQLGLGVWKSDNQTASQSVQWALKHGYRAIDTAKQYGNEAGVGTGLKQGLEANHLQRSDVFLTTKIFNGDAGYQSTLDAFDDQLQRLQTDYVDLVIIHWPVTGKYLDTWRALEQLYRDGKTRAIGVSNFDIERLRDLLEHTSIKPVLNQMEFNPLEQETDIKNYCDENQIILEAWSPLGHGETLHNPQIKRLATKYQKTPAQLILRWELQRGVITIPKSTHEQYIQENADLYDFEIEAADMRLINSLDLDQRTIWYGNFQWNGNPDGFGDTIDQWKN